MNERIQELMAKAMVKTVDMSRPGRKELDPEKFAELIVRECIEIVEPCKCGCRCEQEVTITDSIIAEIKQHFGIEK